MGLEKIIIGQITGATANAFKMNLAIRTIKDKLIDKVVEEIDKEIPFELPISTKEILLRQVELPTSFLDPSYINNVKKDITVIPEVSKQKIRDALDLLEDNVAVTVGVKNDLSGAINTLIKPITTLETLSTTLGAVIPPLKSTVTTLKLVPLPTSVPPGIGIPTNVILGFATSLDALSLILSKTEGPLGIIEGSIGSIQKVISPLLPKLATFDFTFQLITKIISFIRLLLYSNDVNQTDINTVMAATATKITSNLSANPGPFTSNSNPDDNILADKVLLARLQPGALNPLVYRGYQLEIQYDPDNIFYFPSRRIKGSYIPGFLINSIISIGGTFGSSLQTTNNVRLSAKLEGDVRYNLPNYTLTNPPTVISKTPTSRGNTPTKTFFPAPYSFSSSVQVLLSEIKYEIDQFITDRDSIIANEISNIVTDKNSIPIGFIPNTPGISLNTQDQAAIDYVLQTTSKLTNSPSNNTINTNRNIGVVYKSYIARTEKRSWVRDSLNIKIGRIPDQYGINLNFIGSKASNYVISNGGTVLPDYDTSLFPPASTNQLPNTPSNSFASPVYTFPPFGLSGVIGEVKRFIPISNSGLTPTNTASVQFFRFESILPTGGPYSNVNIMGTWVRAQPNVSPFTTPGSFNGETRTKVGFLYYWHESTLSWSLFP